METERKTRIERGETQIIVPTESGDLRYVHPAIRGNYMDVGRQIIERGQLVPTGELTAPLIYSAFFDKAKSERELKDVRGSINNGWLWIFNRNIWAPKGVYVIGDTKAEGLSASFDLKELEDLLSGGSTERGVRFSQDRNVRFALKPTYKLGDHTSGTLAKDGFVIANYDIEGAEQIGEVSSKFEFKPKTYGLNIGEAQIPTQRVSSLGSYRGFGDRLDVFGDVLSDYGYGRAFGVAGSREADEMKK